MPQIGLLERLLAATADRPSPERFRLWAAIWLIGSAVRRKVWTTVLPGQPIYPNMFIWLVGPPGVGKTQAIVPITEYLRKSDTAKLSPNDMTKQALLDRLAKCTDAVLIPGSIPDEFHYMAVAVRELSNFMNQYDSGLAGILTDLWDCPPVNEELKRSGAGAAIVKPGLSMLAGTATKNLGSTIGKDLWGQGFMARIILVYSAELPQLTFFEDDDEEGTGPRSVDHHGIDVSLAMDIAKMAQRVGRIGWEKPAQVLWKRWSEGGHEPKPNHAKLFEYATRRYFHVAKLAMISALSDGVPKIREYDLARALSWLETVEKDMPEIFKEMVVHSDGEIAKEMHMHAFALYSMARRPVHYSQLAAFLMTKVAARDIKRIIENAEEAGMFDRVAGTSGTSAQYIPRVDGQLKDLPS